MSVSIVPLSTQMSVLNDLRTPLNLLKPEAFGRGYATHPLEGQGTLGGCDGQEPALGIEGPGPVPFLRVTSHLMMKERARKRSIGMMCNGQRSKRSRWTR